MKKTNGHPASRRARYDIRKDEDRILMRLEVPGVNKKGLEVNMDGDKLIIDARRTLDEMEGRHLIREIRPGNYHMEFSIDETINRESVEASLENGVLCLSLGLSEAVKPRKIEVVAK